MFILAITPVIVLSVMALAAAGTIRVRLTRGWQPETRRLFLAVIIGAGFVLYLHQGSHCAAVSPDGRLRASVRYNPLLLHAGIDNAVLVVEGPGQPGPIVARERLRSTDGWPVRLAWHPDGRRVACIQRGRGGEPHCEVLSILPRLAAAGLAHRLTAQ